MQQVTVDTAWMRQHSKPDSPAMMLNWQGCRHLEKAARQKTEPLVSLSQTWCSLFSRTW